MNPIPVPRRGHRLALTLALAAIWPVSAAHAQSATELELMRRLDLLAAEVAELKRQIASAQPARSSDAATAGASDVAAGSAAPTAAGVAKPGAQVTAQADLPSQGYGAAVLPTGTATGPATVLSSYGEIHYNRPSRAPQQAQADLRRFVLGLQHRIDDRTKVVGELEVEHSVSSAGDPGEVALEQAYVEHQLNPTWALRAGLFLMPMGLLNENHEPTAYYGVERNFVETAIIPSTWREGGVQGVGTFENGITLQGGVSTGFDLNKWTRTSDGSESPLGVIHQELAKAKARDLAWFGALNWRGVPGLQLGGGLFSGGASHGQALAPARVTLWDLHARWTPGRWDLAALYSRGSISHTAEFNAPLVGGSGTLIPKSFDGAYLQAGYHLWRSGNYALTPFARLERFNTASSYADLGPGLTPSARPSERVITLGANFELASGVVLKADWQRFSQNRELDRSNLGLGWSF